MRTSISIAERRLLLYKSNWGRTMAEVREIMGTNPGEKQTLLDSTLAAPVAAGHLITRSIENTVGDVKRAMTGELKQNDMEGLRPGMFPRLSRDVREAGQALVKLKPVEFVLSITNFIGDSIVDTAGLFTGTNQRHRGGYGSAKNPPMN